MMLHAFKKVLSFCYYLLGFYGLLLLIWWLVDYRLVVELGQGTINKVDASPGETLVVNQPIQKFRNCYGRVYRFLVGECGIHPLVESEAITEKGDQDILIIPFVVPYSSMPGKCSFEAIHRYYCDPLDLLFNRKTYKAPPILFTVKA